MTMKQPRLKYIYNFIWSIICATVMACEQPPLVSILCLAIITNEQNIIKLSTTGYMEVAGTLLM